MPDAAQPDEELNILIATDIHLGYAEKHPEKSGDSFRTFDEILTLAKERQVDFVLLGGDLFHENKPSRQTEMKCIEILRKHVLGDSPIEIEMLSDPQMNFAHCINPSVNYEDPNMNISLPVFSIHGNHDDPSGLGGHSCLDLLHSTGLINYFGRINNLKHITVSPLLIRKGSIKIALYGMSAIKDERLHRLFRSNDVVMQRPAEDQEAWFNLFVLHQNRVKHGVYNYIPEHFIDDFFDLVFWGHEHECRIEPEHIVNGDKEIYVTQPGSPVATSLCEGESRPKKVGLLKVRSGRRFKIEPIELKTVRPMIFKTIHIEDAEGIDFDADDKTVAGDIETYLRNYVEEMIRDADHLLTGHPDQPQKPQLRLRVEYSNEAHQLTPGRFGNHFHDRVANPSEILLFRKRVDKKVKDEGFNDDLMDDIAAQATGLSMEEHIAQYFANVDDKGRMKLLGLKGIAAAVEHFIKKDDKDALGLIVDKQIGKTFDSLMKRDELDEDNFDDELDAFRQARMTTEEAEARATLNAEDRPAGAARDVSMEDEEDEEMDVEPVATGRGRGRGRGRGQEPRGRGRGRGRGRAKAPVAQRAQRSIADSFARQSQSRRSSRNPVVYLDESDED